jgi:antitoxin (DNA-binding transcriptional repressor) of toxin-antitoxin stability system
MATCGYNVVMQAGIRELRDHLSRYIRRIEAGERVLVTAHGRVVAEFVPPPSTRRSYSDGLERLVAAGVITPPAEDRDPLENCPNIRLAPGTATSLIDSDRGES